MKLLLLVAAALLVASQLVSAACHNATGSCTREHFICANEEAIPHSKRCDAVEDCADGSDEYMCDQAPTPLMDLAVAERTAIVEASCIKCTCSKGQITVASGNTAWFAIGLKSPRDLNMMTDAQSYQNKPCLATETASILLNVYKKQNKGCRGWVCCYRQTLCTCSTTYHSYYHCYA